MLSNGRIVSRLLNVDMSTVSGGKKAGVLRLGVGERRPVYGLRFVWRRPMASASSSGRVADRGRSSMLATGLRPISWSP